jgi:hypothetical protein
VNLFCWVCAVFALALACAHFFRFGIVGTTIVIALLQIPVWLVIYGKRSYTIVNAAIVAWLYPVALSAMVGSTPIAWQAVLGTLAFAGIVLVLQCYFASSRR